MSAPDDRDRPFHPPGLAGGALALVTREVSRVPLIALTVGLQAWQRTRGIRALVIRRGGEVLQIAAHTPLGRFLPQPVLDDGADEEAGRIASDARVATAPATRPAARPAATPTPKPAPTLQPASRTELPIPDFDNVSLGSLRARLRSLSVDQLVTLREWEQAHAHRLPVVTLLDNRIAKISADAATKPATDAAAAVYPPDPGSSDTGRVRQ